MRCKYSGCNRKNGIVNGRCRTHVSSTNPLSPPTSPNNSVKNVAIQKSLEEMRTTILQLQQENLALNEQVGELQESHATQKNINSMLLEENGFLRAKINATNYHADSLEQYTRRENIKLVDEEEKENETDEDIINTIVDRANYALSKSEYYKDTKVHPSDIQRAHRVGKKKEQSPGSNTPPKPRKIICRFKSWSLRQKVIKSKKALKGHPTYGNSFITEDLTQYRSKLLWYIKKKCDGRFVNCHTRNGDIYVQLKEAQSQNDDWHKIKSPEDLFKFNIDVDYSVFNDEYLRFSILAPLDVISLNNRFDNLLEATT